MFLLLVYDIGKYYIFPVNKRFQLDNSYEIDKDDLAQRFLLGRVRLKPELPFKYMNLLNI